MVTPNADYALSSLITPVCDEQHANNATRLHREGFCLACAEVYEALHRLILRYSAPPNDSLGAGP
jgi:hypothetical protein